MPRVSRILLQRPGLSIHPNRALPANRLPVAQLLSTAGSPPQNRILGAPAKLLRRRSPGAQFPRPPDNPALRWRLADAVAPDNTALDPQTAGTKFR